MIRANVAPNVIAVPCPFPDQDDLAREAVHIFCAFYEWALPDDRWLQGADRQLAPPTCECPIVRFPMTREFQFANHDEPGSVPAVCHVVTGADAETPIGVCAWCLDQPADVYRYPADIRALGLDQLDNPASYFDGLPPAPRKPLQVHRTPLGWLAAGCHGIVPLDLDALWRTLYELPECAGGYSLAAEDLDHAEALENALDPLPEHVHILVPLPRGSAA
jgi:hypothetical protein